MTALVGLVARSDKKNPGESLDRMLQRVTGGPSPTRGGSVFNPLGLYVAWSNRNGGSGTIVPVWDEQRTVCLIFCGDDYREGASQTSTADSSTPPLLSGYLAHGIAALEKLNGIFCGLIIDLRDGSAVLFNDRYGLGRIYYHEGADGFHFATEAKALLGTDPALRAIDPRGLAEFFLLGCTLQNRTLYPGLHLLPPASAWTFHANGAIAKRRYFDPASWENQPELSPGEYHEQLEAVFGRVMQRYLRGASTGLSLTGGLDSRAVMAWAKVSPGTLPCYTFGGPYRDCADVRIARQLANVCGQPHFTIRIGPDFFNAFGGLAQKAVQVSDGTMDVSGAVELHVNRFASAIAPVRLTGNYGSEILRAHVALRPAQLDADQFTPDFARLLDQAKQTYAAELACHRLSFIAFKQMPWHHFARLSLERAELTPRSPFLDNELVALAFRSPAALRTSAAPMLDLIARGNPKLAGIATDRALQSGPARLTGRLLQRWQDLTVKAEYAYDYGMPRWLARADRVMSPLHVERLFLGRHKFYHFRVWYRDQLSQHVRERAAIVCDERFGWRTGAIRRLAAEHTAGHANHTLALHKALTLQLVDELFLHPA